MISVVTVTYNDCVNLKKTIESVYSQSFDDFEYIIIDGDSKDGTVEFLEQISREKKNLSFISEKDKGIYDAMNKGISQAKGEFILFMGAGDLLYDSNTFELVSNYFDYDVIYGYAIYSSGKRKGKKIGKKMSFLFLIFDFVFAHQAVYAKTELMKKYPFDLKYRVQADQDFLLHMYSLGYKFKYINKPLAYYDGLGFSSNKEFFRQTLFDRADMLSKYFKTAYRVRKFLRFFWEKIRYN